jgi:ribonuclease BN (tRNA processing enzyme)
LIESKDYINHLSIKDIEKIISIKKPKLTILTHFGMTIIKAKPWEITEKLSKKLRVKIIAANDGMEIDLDNYSDY